MEADRLVLSAGLALEPAGHTLVQLGAALLGQSLVGGLANQRVREAKRVLAGEVGTVGADQLLLNERHQVGGRPGLVVFGEQLPEDADVEAAALDRGQLEHGALAAIEAV